MHARSSVFVWVLYVHVCTYALVCLQVFERVKGIEKVDVSTKNSPWQADVLACRIRHLVLWCAAWARAYKPGIEDLLEFKWAK